MTEERVLNLVSELDKPKMTILGGDLAEVAISFKTKMDRSDAQSVECDLFAFAGRRLKVRLQELRGVDEDNQLEMFGERFDNMDRDSLIRVIEEHEANSRTIQRLAFEATATLSVYGIPIMDMEELLSEVEAALDMAKGDHYTRPCPKLPPESFCMYRRTEDGGVEGKSFENKPSVLGDALRDGWSNEHPDHQEPQDADTATQEDSDAGEATERDELYEAAKALIVEAQTASVSMLQREYKIGYNRAACLMDDLEHGGVVSAAIPGKARDVLIKSEETAD